VKEERNVNSTASTTTVSPAILHVHTELDRRLAEFQSWRDQLCELGQPRYGEMGVRVQQIRELLNAHFAAEEAGGYFCEVVEEAPCLKTRAADLQREHQQILNELDALTTRLTASPASFDSWSESCQAFGRLLDRMQAHERAEEAMVETAFGTDSEQSH
jgi:hypothetical protein